VPSALPIRPRRCALIQIPNRRNRHVLTLLSSLWPGLGQFAAGSRRLGLVLALPPLALVALGVGALASPDRVSRLAQLLDPAVIGTLLVIELLLLAWRLTAVVDAFRRGDGDVRGRAAGLTAIGLLFVLVPSVYAAYLTEVAREAAVAVFSAVEHGPYRPAGPPPADPDHDFGSPIPVVTPAPDLGRFTVLLIGVDSGPGRSTALTDTMIVASLDPIAGAVSMISLPRDTVDVPLPDGRVFRPKINSLMAYATLHPEQFPGAPSGQSVLAAAIGQLLGVQIDGWAQVNLPGFVRVIDSLGGVDVTVHKGFCDAGYQEYGLNGFAIQPGRYHFNGDEALAYARVRKAIGENDFTRAGRQQEIVVAVRDRVVGGGFLGDPAGFAASFGLLLKTSLEPSALLPYVEVASHIDRDHVFRQVIQPPLVHSSPGDIRGSIQVPDLEGIRALGAAAFPPAGTLPEGLATIPLDDGGTTTSTLPKVTCYYVPPPSPSPTPSPSASPSPAPSVDPTPVPSDTPKPGGGPPSPSPDPTAEASPPPP
jgi:LCP family protein required for cell wall assembly